MRLRKPPYGPKTQPVGNGFALQSNSAQLQVSGSYWAIPEEPTELQAPASGPAILFRPRLERVSNDNLLRMSLDLHVLAGPDWVTADEVQFELQLSRDETTWTAFAAVNPTIYPVENTAGEPSTYNSGLHTVRYVADLPASALPGAGTTVYGRVMAVAPAEDLSVATLNGGITVTLEEVENDSELRNDARRPSAGVYRTPRYTGAVIAGDMARRSQLAAPQVVTGEEEEVLRAVGSFMRPELTPLERASRLRLRGQLIAASTNEIDEDATLTISYQLSDDDFATAVEIGVMAPVVQSATTGGGTSNPRRFVYDYQAEVDILTAFPSWDGEEIKGRVTILSSPEGENRVSIGNDGGSQSATFLKLEELRG